MSGQEAIYQGGYTTESRERVNVEIAVGEVTQKDRLVLWINNFGVMTAPDTIAAGQLFIRDLGALTRMIERAQEAIGEHIADKMDRGETR